MRSENGWRESSTEEQVEDEKLSASLSENFFISELKVIFPALWSRKRRAG
jgi:hypothetical protein